MPEIIYGRNASAGLYMQVTGKERIVLCLRPGVFAVMVGAYGWRQFPVPDGYLVRALTREEAKIARATLAS